MPWTIVGEASSEWTAVTIASPYIAAGYIEPGYYDDEEWTIVPDDEEIWTLVA